MYIMPNGLQSRGNHTRVKNKVEVLNTVFLCKFHCFHSRKNCISHYMGSLFLRDIHFVVRSEKVQRYSMYFIFVQCHPDIDAAISVIQCIQRIFTAQKVRTLYSFFIMLISSMIIYKNQKKGIQA